MTMTKTLGGDRLGSGKRMKVHMHGYERSTHNLGYLWRSTLSAGTLVPFMSEVALPGDTFDIFLECDIKTHPTIGPLFGSYKVQLDTFLAPIRLYNSWLHNNKLNIGRNMSAAKLPQIELTATDTTDATDLDNSQINPSCLLSYFGIRGVGVKEIEPATRTFNVVPILAYWDVYKNYYANKQEVNGAVIHAVNTTIASNVTSITVGAVLLDGSTPAPATNGTQIILVYSGGTAPSTLDILIMLGNGFEYSLYDLSNGEVDDGVDTLTINYNYVDYGDQTLLEWRYREATDPVQVQPTVTFFPLEYIDQMRELILQTDGGVQFKINDANLVPYEYLYDQPGGIPNSIFSQEGLAVKTYQSDLFNNWLSTEWIDGTNGINEITAIDTSGGSFTIDTLNLSKKVYDMLNRIAVSGGTYDDWLDAVWTHDRFMRAETPMYMGGLIRELVFQEVVSNSQSEDQPLGTLAGKGIMSGKRKGGKVVIKVDEPSYIIGIISLTPRIDYSQGNKWDTHLQTMDDFHKPALDEIGFQELITEKMAWWDTHYDDTTNEWIQKSAGKQPAWIDYMTNYNRTYGNFAIPSNEMFMTLNRRYEADNNQYIDDLTTYIDPSKFNFIFAQTSLDAQNFWAQIAVDITARRKMSAKVMPNL